MVIKSCFFSLFLAGALLLQINVADSWSYTLDIIKVDIDSALDKCNQCRILVDHIQTALTQGSHTVEPLLELIERICHHMFGGSAKECDNIINNATEFINYILTHNTTYLCHQMRDC
jgi:hypothetical protein